MRAVRITFLIVLLPAGLASVIYGALFHEVVVEEQKQREISIMVPMLPGMEEARPFEPPALRQPPNEEGNPFAPPGVEPQRENPFENRSAMPAPPGMKMQTVTEDYVESEDTPEWVIVREVTIGGVVRLANGHLKRTYSGKSPALCPS
jgi:hypothetical protein